METEHSERAAELTAEIITEALRGVRYPGLTRDLVSFGMVHHVSDCDGRVKVQLALRAPDAATRSRLDESIDEALRALGAKSVAIEIVAPKPAPTAKSHATTSDPWAEQARLAGVGIAPELLLRDLNQALGIEDASSAGEASSTIHVERASGGAVPTAGGESQPGGSVRDGADATAPERPLDAPVSEIDVREDLRSGNEPFSKILAAVAALGADEVLRLRATFEPVPLFTVLGKRGFVHESAEHVRELSADGARWRRRRGCWLPWGRGPACGGVLTIRRPRRSRRRLARIFHGCRYPRRAVQRRTRSITSPPTKTSAETIAAMRVPFLSPSR